MVTNALPMDPFKVVYLDPTKDLTASRASVHPNYVKLFGTGVDRHNGILMSLLLLVAETKSKNTNGGVLFIVKLQAVSLQPYQN